MAKAVQKITLSTSRDVPFNKLVLSQSNVRRLKAGVSIEDLAEDIARRGLLQSLNVRPVLDTEGAETGMFEIPAGGRRYRALERLVKQKRLSKMAPVPCIVRDPGVEVSAEEDSLAENVQRVALHPLDQFRAFKTLRDQGAGEEEIAARFFVAPAVVKQRLRLAAVSEKLLHVYAEDGMTLEQLMAFTVTTDHARQEEVWEALQQSYNKEPYLIRRQLTESAVRASDRRARFVGLEVYEAAGGVVLRDLFEDDNGGWLEDLALLDRLATEKLAADAQKIAGEGWKWIEVAVDFRYGHTSHLRQLDGVTLEFTPDEQVTFDALTAEYDRLEAEYEGADELPDEAGARLAEIETALAAFENRPVHYESAEVACAGAFVSIDADGHLAVDRGYVRPEDEPSTQADGDAPAEDETREAGGTGPAPSDVQRTVITIGGGESDDDDDGGDDAVKPLPERLVSELTAHRTLALRDAMANNPEVALTALLHKLCLDTFQHSAPGACLEASVRHVFFPVQAADLKNSPSAKAVADRHEAWKAELPKGDEALWDWLAVLDDTRRVALLAHCVSFGINALYEKGDRYGGPGVSAHGVQHRIAQADRLARAVGLDMVEAGWRPTVDNYLGRVTKPRILEAVREAKGEPAAQLIDHLKKAEMAKEAERLLDSTGWLPEPLRLADSGDVSDTPTDTVEELPAFLADDEEQDAPSEGVVPHPILVFSDAGGTGRSYHADLGARNRRLRVHYLLEAGWKADTAIQGLGRSNRTNQAQPPLFRPIATNVKAEKRFLSTIARRLDTLGAITKGQRQTGGQGLFRADDNLESPYGRAALRQLYLLLFAGKVEGCSLYAFEDATGLHLTNQDGSLREELPPITTFLNRLLALTIDLQNTLFGVFEDLLRAKIEGARAFGTYDVGVETLTAESLVVTDRRSLYTHPQTGAETQVFTIRRRERNRPFSLAEALDRADDPRTMLLANAQSGRAAVQVPAPSLMLDDGEVERRVRLLRPMERTAMPLATLDQTHWEQADRVAFTEAWERELVEIPAFTESDLHVVTGLLLPIWKRLPDDSMRVYRLQTDAGERVIGRLVSPAWVAQAVSADGVSITPADAWAAVLDGRTILELQDGLSLRRARVMGLFRVELCGFTDGMVERLKAMGLISEIIAWKLRLFVPTGAAGPAILAGLMEHHPIVRIADRAAA